MDTLRCIHNILTAGIFVLFCLVCFLVNKCCQCGPCGEPYVYLDLTYGENSRRTTATTSLNQESENAVSNRVKDNDPKVIDKPFTSQPSPPVISTNISSDTTNKDVIDNICSPNCSSTCLSLDADDAFKPKPNDVITSDLDVTMKNEYVVPETGYKPDLYTCDAEGATICPEMYLKYLENKSESLAKCKSCAVFQAKSYDNHGKMNNADFHSLTSPPRSCHNVDIKNILSDTDSIISSHVKPCRACGVHAEVQVQVSDIFEEHSVTDSRKQQVQEKIVDAEKYPSRTVILFDARKQQVEEPIVEAKQDVVFNPSKQQVEKPIVEAKKDVVFVPSKQQVEEPIVEAKKDVVFVPSKQQVEKPIVEAKKDVIFDPSKTQVEEPIVEAKKDVVFVPSKQQVEKPIVEAKKDVVFVPSKQQVEKPIVEAKKDVVFVPSKQQVEEPIVEAKKDVVFYPSKQQVETPIVEAKKDVVFDPSKQQVEEPIVEVKKDPSKHQEQETIVKAKENPEDYTTKKDPANSKHQVKEKINEAKKDLASDTARIMVTSSSDESEEIVKHTVRVKVRGLDSDLQSNVQRTHEHTTPSGTKISIIGPFRNEDLEQKKKIIGTPPRECVRECPGAPVVVKVPFPEYIQSCVCEETMSQFAYPTVPSPRTYEQYNVSPSNLMKDASVGVDLNNLNIPSTSHRNYDNDNEDPDMINQSEKAKFKFDCPCHSDIISKRKASKQFYKEDTPKLTTESRRMYDEIPTDTNITNRNRCRKSNADVSEEDNSDQLNNSIPNYDPGKYIDDEDCKLRKNKIKDKYSAPTQRRDVNDGSYGTERQVSDADVVSTEDNVTEFPPVAEGVYSRLHGEKTSDGPVCPTGPVSNAADTNRQSSHQRNKTNDDNSRQIKTPPSYCGSRCISHKEFIPFDKEVDSLYKKYANNESYKSSLSTCETVQCNCDEIIRLMHEKYGTHSTIKCKKRSCESISQELSSLNINNPIGKDAFTTSSFSEKKTDSKQKNIENEPKNSFSTTSSPSKQDSGTQQYFEESITPNKRSSAKITYSKQNNKENEPKNSFSTSSSPSKQDSGMQQYFEESSTPNKRRKIDMNNYFSPKDTSCKTSNKTLSSKYPDKKSVTVVDNLASESKKKLKISFCPACSKKSEESSTITDKKNNDKPPCKAMCTICKQIMEHFAREISEEDIGHIQREKEDEIHCPVCGRLLDIEKDKCNTKLRCHACLEAIRAEINRTDTEKLSDSDIECNVSTCENMVPRNRSDIIDFTTDISSTKPLVRIRPKTCYPCNCNSYSIKKVSSKVTIMSKCNTNVEAFTNNEEYFKNNKYPLVRITIDLENPSTKTDEPDNGPDTPDNTDYDKFPDLPPDYPPKYSPNNDFDKCCNCTDIKQGESVLEYVNRMRRNSIIPYPACYEYWSRRDSASSTNSTVKTDENLSSKIEEESYTTSTEEQNPTDNDSDYSFATISNEKLPPKVKLPEILNMYNVSLEKEYNKSNFEKKRNQPEKNVMKYFSDKPLTSGDEKYGKFYPYRNKYKRPISQPLDYSCIPACKYYRTNDMIGEYHRVMTDQPQPQVPTRESISKREMDVYSADKSACSYLLRDNSFSPFQNCHSN